MDMCGYHLRCLNHEKKCAECARQNKGRTTDYLRDVLTAQAKDKEADNVPNADLS